MSFASKRTLSLISRALMLASAAAYLLQGIFIANSQIAAAFGILSQPAVVISGASHFYDPLAGNVHHHDGDNAEGHVHTAAADDHDHDSDTPDRSGCVSICSLFSASISFPSSAPMVAPFRRSAAVASFVDSWRQGVDPAALIRPPSISSIV